MLHCLVLLGLGAHCENGVCCDHGGDDLPDDLGGKVVTVYLLQPLMNFHSLGHCFDELTCIAVIGKLRILSSTTSLAVTNLTDCHTAQFRLCPDRQTVNSARS